MPSVSYKNWNPRHNERHSPVCLPVRTNFLNMSLYSCMLVACVMAVMLMDSGAQAQGVYYYNRNVVPVTRYRPSAPVYNRNSYNAYNPYTANVNRGWNRPAAVQQYYYDSIENHSGESREVYRGYRW
ncbi:hypothetical protein GHT06_012341 [Daphnia sinensis]|uniref:Uncharacterized protein n=1 Tax=Daphnia sinensis TaxID=1820382 RepID=A0AAD5KXE0_9CRUS|nr:hypothetical protein GHT06_012341 [Daphnia sinensis]